MLKPVLCGGEILFDFISEEAGRGLAESTQFEKRPGGSIFNVAVGLRRLGMPCSLLTKIGGDEFSQGLVDIIQKEKIGVECLKRNKNLKTTIAFAAINEEGKPEFRFYRDKAADTMLTIPEVNNINPQDYSLYHFGSISLLKKPASDSYLEVLDMFHKRHIKISLDPNIRPSLIRNRKKYLKMFLEISEMVDILKMSDDDLQYITGSTDLEESFKILPSKEGHLIFVTLGKNGAATYYKNQFIHIPAFTVRVKDTTGCGDAFMAAIIFKLLNFRNFQDISKLQLMDTLTFANAAAAIVATRYGASNSMPKLSEVDRFIAVHSLPEN